MSAAHLAADDRPRGLETMLRIVARIQRRSALTWVLVLGAMAFAWLPAPKMKI